MLYQRTNCAKKYWSNSDAGASRNSRTMIAHEENNNNKNRDARNVRTMMGISEAGREILSSARPNNFIQRSLPLARVPRMRARAIRFFCLPACAQAHTHTHTPVRSGCMSPLYLHTHAAYAAIIERGRRVRALETLRAPAARGARFNASLTRSRAQRFEK